MRSAPPHAWLAALALCAASAGSAQATETDQYIALGKPPRDSLAVLNEKANRELLGALELVNRRAHRGLLTRKLVDGNASMLSAGLL